MNSKEAIETAKCMKESLDTGKIIEPQNQSILMENLELKDIVLKKGDVITYKNGQSFIYQEIDDKVYENAVIKIERPVKYKTIYEIPKQILDKEEKEWLEHFLRPFIKDFVSIVKTSSILLDRDKLEYIKINLKHDIINLPAFKENTIYKGMQYNKEYTLEELGLFKE